MQRHLYRLLVFMQMASLWQLWVPFSHALPEIIITERFYLYQIHCSRNFDKIFFYGISEISRATTHFSEFATCFNQCLIVVNLSFVLVQWSAGFVTVIELSLFDPLLHLRSMTSQLPVINSTTPRSKFS